MAQRWRGGHQPIERHHADPHACSLCGHVHGGGEAARTAAHRNNGSARLAAARARRGDGTAQAEVLAEATSHAHAGLARYRGRFLLCADMNLRAGIHGGTRATEDGRAGHSADKPLTDFLATTGLSPPHGRPGAPITASAT